MSGNKQSRAIIDDLFNGVRVTVSPQKDVFTIFFMCVMLAGWGIAGYNIAGLIMEDSKVLLFLSIWLVGWTFAGLFFMYVILWSLFGMEEMLLENGVLIKSRKLFVLGSSKQYDITKVQNMRVDTRRPGRMRKDGRKRSTLESFGVRGGSLKFDHDNKTISFGINLPKEEAEEVMNALKKKMKHTVMS